MEGRVVKIEMVRRWIMEDRRGMSFSIKWRIRSLRLNWLDQRDPPIVARYFKTVGHRLDYVVSNNKLSRRDSNHSVWSMVIVPRFF